MMSIIGSMYNATTALDAFGVSMAVIGNNIANVNTSGFKASRVDFADVFPTTMGELETGRGVSVVDAGRVYRQGGLETTSKPTDLAVAGNGFFVLRDPQGGIYYSRAGQFHLNEARELINSDGLRVQGAAGDVSLATVQIQAARATTNITTVFNLDASASTPSVPFPVTLDAKQSDWAAASNFSLTAAIYDSLGEPHDLTFYFRKTAPSAWEYRVAAARSELDPGATNSTEMRQVGAGGTLVFDANGRLSPTLSTISDISGLTWVNGAASQAIPATGLNFGNSTQLATASTQMSLFQDGWPSGSLASIDIDSRGTLRAIYTNGNAHSIDVLQLAHFANPDGLEHHGSTLVLPTLASGAPQIGAPGTGGRGSIVPGALELSTVDLASEFVTMIVSQRAFQVNSQVITTADEMYTVAAQLKA